MPLKATKAQERIRTLLATFINERHPVAVAVEKQRADAIKRTGEQFDEMVQKMGAELQTAGWDLNKVAPRPLSGKMNRYDYEAAMAKHQRYNSVVANAPERGPAGYDETYGYRPQRPGEYRARYVRLDTAKVKRAREEALQRAAWDYDAFIVKLTKKIGACKKAVLSGSHVWGYSFLKVTKEDGTKEVWKTQQIVNVSKLGRLFNQWPSRKVKGLESDY